MLTVMEQEPTPKSTSEMRRRNINIALFVGAAALILTAAFVLAGHNHSRRPGAAHSAHANVTTTVFWVGEPADESNANIPNRSSTWVEDWEGAFGGADNPDDRCNNLPCGFTPKENPFYFALPYNDLDTSCEFKSSQQEVPWFSGTPEHGHSIIKNRWIKVAHNGKTAYAQWEDAGPLGEDDTGYVFGNSSPHYEKSGLDLSPATADYLGLDGKGKTSWEFVDEKDVPDGPWRQTITTSLPDCAD